MKMATSCALLQNFIPAGEYRTWVIEVSIRCLDACINSGTSYGSKWKLPLCHLGFSVQIITKLYFTLENSIDFYTTSD